MQIKGSGRLNFREEREGRQTPVFFPQVDHVLPYRSHPFISFCPPHCLIFPALRFLLPIPYEATHQMSRCHECYCGASLFYYDAWNDNLFLGNNWAVPYSHSNALTHRCGINVTPNGPTAADSADSAQPSTQCQRLARLWNPGSTGGLGASICKLV